MSADHQDATISRRVRALETLLEERGVVSGDRVDGLLDRFLATASPLNGGRLVARAWMEHDFRQRLFDDGNRAVGEFGFPVGGVKDQVFRVVENTVTVHNVIVCTLCSCYPVGLLGPSPAWYKSEAYRSRIVRDPHGVLGEFGLELAPGVDIQVWDSSAETRYMVLPRRPAGTDSLSEQELSRLVTRNGLIGTAHV